MGSVRCRRCRARSRGGRWERAEAASSLRRPRRPEMRSATAARLDGLQLATRSPTPDGAARDTERLLELATRHRAADLVDRRDARASGERARRVAELSPEVITRLDARHQVEDTLRECGLRLGESEASL